MSKNLDNLENALDGALHDLGIAKSALAQMQAGTMAAQDARRHIIEGIGSASSILDEGMIYAKRLPQTERRNQS